MNIVNAFTRMTHRFRKPQESAKFAKERLQIIISHERIERDQPDFLAALQKDLLDVIGKYVAIDKDAVRVELDRQEGCAILELNVVLPQLHEEATTD